MQGNEPGKCFASGMKQMPKKKEVKPLMISAEPRN
jgi:hypothetical protein